MKVPINTYGPWRLIDGEPVTLDPPHDKPFRFAAVHWPHNPAWWSIINVETGMSCGAGETKQAALEKANCLLAEYTAQMLRTVIRHRRQSGHVPPSEMLDAVQERTT
jgi:hypothetical protein